MGPVCNIPPLWSFTLRVHKVCGNLFKENCVTFTRRGGKMESEVMSYVTQ